MSTSELDVVAADAPPGGDSEEPRAPVSDRDASLAGMVAAAAALGFGEFVGGLSSSVPSLATSTGQLFIPYVPEWLKAVAITAFGLADKPVFVIGVVVVTLLLGRWVGRRARSDVAVPTALFLGFALFGAFASARQPGASALLSTMVAVAGAAVGLGALRWLLLLPPVPSASGVADADGTGGSDDRALGRRPFLVASGLVTGGAVGGAAVGYALRRSRFAAAVAAVEVEPPVAGGTLDAAPAVTQANSLAVDGLTPVVVPNDAFYRIDTALGTPLVDAATWQLTIGGMVDTPLTIDYDTLRGGDVVERYVTLSCVSNEVGGGLVGNALWRGVLLGPLLERAGVQPGAGQVVGRSVDGWDAGFPLEAAFDRDAMVAFAMNDEPLPVAHGFPARLVVPGLYGYVSATKWLSEIELTTWEGFDGYWVPRGWSKEGPIKTQSRIDVPLDGTRLDAPGETVAAGIAWAPLRGVERVEVRRRTEDGGGEWVEAELSTPLSDAAWVQWRATVDLPSGPSFLQVRATDGDGVVQTDELARPAPDGATGHHTIRVFA